MKTLDDDLIGLYIFGSLAHGCYHPATSDVDVMAVMRENVGNPDSEVIVQLHRNVGLPMDTVFVDERQINADIFPTPLRFLIKTRTDLTGFSDWPDRFLDVPEGRGDFLTQRQDVYEAGITLYGPAPQDIIRPVPWSLLTESLDFLFPYIVSHFKNSALMLCRIAYTWTNREMCSKRQAGEWALKAFGDQWTPIIRTALEQYAAGQPQSGVSQDTLKALEQHCAGYIDKLRI